METSKINNSLNTTDLFIDKGIGKEETVDIKKLLESIDNIQEQLKMLETSKEKITEKLISYKGLHLFLSHFKP